MNRRDGKRTATVGLLAGLAAMVLLGGCGAPAAGGPRSDYLAKAREILPQALRDNDPGLRALGLEAYKDLRLTPPQAEMTALLKEPEAPLRFMAMLVKAQQARPMDLPIFEKAYREETDSSVRLAAVYGLARLNNVSRIKDLRDGLRSNNVLARRNAAYILGQMGNVSAVGMLRPGLKDSDPGVRLNVAEALCRLGDTTALEPLRQMVGDPESFYQVYAIMALGRVGAPGEDIKIMRKLEAGHPSSPLASRLAAFGSRAMLGDYSQVQQLMGVATETSQPVNDEERAFALQLLARSAYFPAWREAGQCLESGNAAVRYSAAWAQLAFDTPRAEKVAKAIGASPSPQHLSQEDVLRPPTKSPAGRSAPPASRVPLPR